MKERRQTYRKAVIGWDVLTLMETPPTVNKEEGLGSLSRQSLSGLGVVILEEQEEAMVSIFHISELLGSLTWLCPCQ